MKMKIKTREDKKRGGRKGFENYGDDSREEARLGERRER